MAVHNPPYGNIFEIETPKSDKLIDRIYLDQKQRELYKQQQDKMLDDEFARNMSGIRDSDIGELTKAYGDYKLAHQQFSRKSNGTPQEQLDVLRKKSAIYDIINKSKQEKEWEDLQLKQGSADKKGMYADDWQQQLFKRRQTPVSQIDRAKDGDILYKYSIPDLSKEIEKARGKKRKVEVPIGVSKTDPFKDDVEEFEVGNTPKQFYDSVLTDVVTKNQGRNFSLLYNNKYSDSEFDGLVNKYEAKVRDPKFVAVYGKPEPFTDGSRGMTDLEKAAAILTMEEVVNLPLSGKTVSKVNVGRQTADRQNFAKEQQARAHKNSLARLYVYASISDRKPERIQENIDGLIGNHIEDARANGGVVVTDNKTYETITGKKMTGSSVLMFDEANNKYVYGRKEDDGNGGTKFMPIGEVPIDLARIKLTKDLKGGLDSKFNTGKKIEPKDKKSVSLGTIKSLVGKPGYEGYTEKELIEYYKSNGYEIKQ